MTDVVYATVPAVHFHKTDSCPAFHNAQELNDWDCGCDTYCTHRSPRLWELRQMSLEAACAVGKRPCTTCYHTPAEARAVLPTSQETFGHTPIDQYANTPEGDLGVTHIVCARCMTSTFHRDVQLLIGSRVAWPCLSAIVLGLVPRPVRSST